MLSGKLRKAVSSALAAVLLAAGLFLPAPARAQTASTGVLTGVGEDGEGQGGAHARVPPINVGTNATREAHTSGEGVYEISQLTPGTYRVEVEASGFSKSVQENVAVNVLQRTTINASLKVGSVTEVVNVTAENAPLVETSKTDVSGVVDQRRVGGAA